MSIGISQVQAPSRAAFTGEAGTVSGAIGTLFDLVSAAGQRGAPALAVSRALVAYWRALPSAGRAERAGLLPLLREAVRRGATTSRAWTCVALGDPDFAIVREATLGYLGAPAVSLERREQCVSDVLDWIVRGLALDRAAAFAALVDLNDAVVLERLAGYRGRLSLDEAAGVWRAHAGTTSPVVREFVEQWRCDEQRPV